MSRELELPCRATRRRPEQVRGLLLSAASSEFAVSGFSGANTSNIARQAGVTSSVLFRHFPTKAELFEAASVGPFMAYMGECRAVWERHRRTPASDRELMTSFVSDLYDTVHARREPVLAMLLAANEPRAHPAARAALQASRELFTELSEHSTRFARSTDIGQADMDIRLRYMTAMIVAGTVFDNWFMPARSTRQQRIEQCVALILGGAFGATGEEYR